MTAPRPDERLAEAIWGTLQSPNELDSNWEAANVVDGLAKIARAIHRLAEAVERFNPREEDEP